MRDRERQRERHTAICKISIRSCLSWLCCIKDIWSQNINIIFGLPNANVSNINFVIKFVGWQDVIVL